MADIKFIEIIPVSGSLGTKIIYFTDAPGGLSFTREHLKPISPRRTQDGTLISQQLRYNKKTFTISGSLYKITIHTYLKDLFESGIRATLKVWYENSSYVATLEFNGSVTFINYTDDMDEISNIRTITATFSEN
jgi:hypothetical protein